MGKKKGFDIITEAHERADNNINPYYWFNRVTAHQISAWKVSKMFYPLFFLFLSIILSLRITYLNHLAVRQERSFVSLFFDLSDSASTAQFVGFFLLLFFWIVTGIGTAQNIFQYLIREPLPSEQEKKRAKKKKQPKRPKNYK